MAHLEISWQKNRILMDQKFFCKLPWKVKSFSSYDKFSTCPPLPPVTAKNGVTYFPTNFKAYTWVYFNFLTLFEVLNRQIQCGESRNRCHWQNAKRKKSREVSSGERSGQFTRPLQWICETSIFSLDRSHTAQLLCKGISLSWKIVVAVKSDNIGWKQLFTEYK